MKDLRKVLAGLVLMGGFVSIAVSCDNPQTSEPTTFTINVPTSVENGTVSIDASSVEEGGSVTITVTPSQNYLLESLTVNGQAVTVDDDGKAVISNITANQNIEVSFKGVDVPVSFIFEDEVVSSKTYEYGTTYGTLPSLASVPTGYTFEGWFTQTNGQGEKLADNAKVSNPEAHSYYAYCTANSYEITFDVAEGTLDTTSLEATYAQAIGQLPVPSKDGHLFVNWTDEEGNVVNANTVYNYTKDITLTANYATVEINQGDARLVNYPNQEAQTLTVAPVVMYKGENITANYDFVLKTTNPEAVVVNGLTVQAAANSENLTSTVQVCIGNVVYAEFDVTTMDYVGLGYQTVSNLAEFKAMTGTGKYLLTADIDFNKGWFCDDVNWVPLISTLQAGAVIDGNGYAVKNAHLPGGWNKGWIGVVQGTVRNISFINITSADANPFSTGLIGTVNNYGTLENIFVQATIPSDGNTSDMWTRGGVLVGNFDKGTIKDVVLDITVPQGVSVNAYGAFAGVMCSWECQIYNSYAIVHHSGLAAYAAEAAEGVYVNAVKDGTGTLYNSVHQFLTEVGANNSFNSLWTFEADVLKFNGNTVLTGEKALDARVDSEMVFELEDENSYIDFSVYSYGELTDDYTATFESADPTIFTVDEYGVVTFLKEGTADLIITVNGQIELTTSITILPTIIEISNADQWRTLISTNPAGKFVLTADIDLGGGWFTPSDSAPLCAEFTGTLDGQGHTVSNGWLIGGWAHTAAFPVNKGTIKNIGFIDVHGTNVITNSAIVGDNFGTLENIFVDFIIEPGTNHGDFAGTLVGYTSTGTVNNCIVNVKLGVGVESAPNYYGSLVGNGNAWASVVTNSFAIANGTGIKDIAAMEAAAGIIDGFKAANVAQYETYAALKESANVESFDSTLWSFGETTLSFGGKVVVTYAPTPDVPDTPVDPDDGYTYIHNVEEWYTLLAANPAGLFKLANDLDFENQYLTPNGDAFLSTFEGELNGNGYLVKNAKLPGGWAHNNVFGVNTGTIHNIGFINLQGNKLMTNVALMSENNGLVENVYVDFVVDFDGVVRDGTQAPLSAYSGSGITQNCITNIRLADGSTGIHENYGSLVGRANKWASQVINSHAIVNDSGIEDISGTDAADGGVTAQFKAAGCAQHLTYGDLLKDADLTSFNSDIWDFSDSGLYFNGVLVVEWDGTTVEPEVPADPDDGYTYIHNAAEWRTLISANPAGLFKLANDIDLEGGSLTPTTTSILCSDFTGELLGQGYSVSNGTLPGGWAHHVLISNNKGTIKDIAFINIISNQVCTNTALIGENYGVIENVYVDMVVNSNGTNYTATAAPLLSYSGTGSMSNCIVNLRLGNTCEVAPDFYGSLVGNASRWTSVVANCHAIVNDTGIVDIAAAEAAAGVMQYLKDQGSAQHLTYADLLANADLTSFNSDAWDFSTSGLYFYGKLVLECEVSDTPVVPETPVDPDDGYTYIHNVEEWYTLLAANPSGLFKLANNIDFQNQYLTPNGEAFLTEFSGEFNGNGYVIYNGKLPGGWSHNNVFGINTGTIHNVAFINLQCHQLMTNVSLIEENNGLIENIYVDFVLAHDGVERDGTQSPIVAWTGSGLMQNCVTNVRLGEGMESAHPNVGSLVGRGHKWASQVANSHAIINDTGIEDISGTDAASGAVTDQFKAAGCAQHLTYADLLANANLSSFNSDIWDFAENVIYFSGTLVLEVEEVAPETPVEPDDGYTYIHNAEEWRTLISANPAGLFKLANDIDLAGGWFTPSDAAPICAEFTGILDGQGYSVSHGWLIGGWAHTAAFPVNFGTIKNIAFIDIHGTSVITNSAIVGDNKGLLENIYVDFIIENGTKHGDFAGTLAGYSGIGEIKNCIVNVRLGAGVEAAPDYYGSIVGNASAWASVVSNSFAIANGTGIQDIAAMEAAGGILDGFKAANCAQYDTYTALKANANVESFDSTLWSFGETTLSFGGKVVLSVA